MIHATADVEPGAVVGPGTEVWRWTHIRGTAMIGADCLVGAGVYIDAGVVVGDRVKIGNRAQLFLPARVGNGVFIGPGVCLTNDRIPRAVNADDTLKESTDWLAAGADLDDGASIGAMATVLPGISVGRWAMVGAGSIVTRDVRDHALVVGNPAVHAGWVCSCGLRLDSSLACSCGRSYHPVDSGLAEAHV